MVRFVCCQCEAPQTWEASQAPQSFECEVCGMDKCYVDDTSPLTEETA